MGPVNLRNSNYSSSVRLTVKNTILDRAFTRLFKISITRLGTEILDFWKKPQFCVSIFEAGQFIFSIP
jgi:hypothetical protein